MRIHLMTVLLALGLTVGTQATTTHYVVPPDTPGANPSGTFTSWATAATNIADAVGIATNNSVVLVAPGHYLLTNAITINAAITLRSDNNGLLDAAGTILDAQYPAYTNRCIFIDNVAAVVDGFTFTNGFAAATDQIGNGGGAYLNLQGRVQNAVFAGNRAFNNGGGAYLYQGGVVAGCSFIGNVAMTNGVGYGGGVLVTVTNVSAPGLVTNCLFSGNSARRGGGVFLSNSSETSGGSTLVDCDIFENTAIVTDGGDGGAGVGIYRRNWVSDCNVVSNVIVQVAGSSYGAGISASPGATIRNSWIAFNAAGTYGGGISNLSRAMVTNCVIESNTAVYGGGIYSGGQGLVVDSIIKNNSTATYMQGGTYRNCLFVGNGGRIWAHNITGVTFENCTIYGNSEGPRLEQPSVMENCIVYGNTVNWLHIGAGTNTVWINSCTTPLPTGPDDVGNIADDPRFVHATGGDFNLRGSSPCINQGVFRDWMTGAMDLDGKTRVIGPAVDMGAFEYLPLSTLMQIR